MNLVIDKRKTNIIYVDKDNNHVANNNDIIKLIATNNTSAIGNAKFLIVELHPEITSNGITI